MTRDEAVKAIKSHCYFANLVPVGKEALDMAIKALEQEPTLDKIRAEIESMDFDFGDFYDHTNEIIEMLCKVIDKYKAESEE